MASMHFRANVVAIISDGGDRVMAFERADLPGQWQLPQGGVDHGESPRDAAWRELEEETGLTADDVSLVDEYSEWTAYEWPGGQRKNGRLGQAQRWFTFCVARPDVRPEPDGIEFNAWKWVSREWLVDNVADFRRPSYRRVLLSDGV